MKKKIDDIKVIVAYVKYMAELMELIITNGDNDKIKERYEEDMLNLKKHLNNGCSYTIRAITVDDDCYEEICRDGDSRDTHNVIDCLSMEYYDCTCGLEKK